MDNNNFDFEKLTRIATEKFSGLSVDNIDDLNTLNDELAGMEQELKNMMTEEVSNNISLGFKNLSNNQDPEYVYEGDSGFDLRANLESPVTLKPLERHLVPTGLYFQIPEGYEIQVRPRSGLAAKQGISVLNTPGTVDQGYTGEVKVILVNLSNDKVTIEHGERVAQAVLCPVLTKRNTTLTKLNNITSTDRGEGGFGSTGKK